MVFGFNQETLIFTDCCMKGNKTESATGMLKYIHHGRKHRLMVGLHEI